MELYFEDTRPLSALQIKAFEKKSLLGGLLAALLATAFPSIIFAVRVAGDADRLISQQANAEEISEAQEPEVIAAAFVQLGRHFDPRELPDRQTATSSLAQQRPDPNAVSMHTREEWDGGIPPPNAYASTLDRLGNRADYVETMLAPELEGTSEGTEEGRNSREGSLYAGQLYTLFRRGWNAPDSITDAEYANLSATVSLVIGDNLKIVSVRLTRPSGNGDFDRSVENRLAEIRESNVTFPEPPMEERGRFIGQPIAIRFVPPNRVRRSSRTPSGNSVLENLGAGY